MKTRALAFALAVLVGLVAASADAPDRHYSLDEPTASGLGQLMAKQGAISRLEITVFEPGRKNQPRLAVVDKRVLEEVRVGLLAATKRLINETPDAYVFNGALLRADLLFADGSRSSFWVFDHETGFSCIRLPQHKRLFRSSGLRLCLGKVMVSREGKLDPPISRVMMENLFTKEQLGELRQ